MVKTLVKVLLDTNVLVSSIVFGGKPRQIFQPILKRQLIVVTSLMLLAELTEVLSKKFHFNQEKILLIERKIKKIFLIVYPKETIKVLKDMSDNRVLEAAMEGNCDYIVTGDQELLQLSTYEKIKIVPPDEFLRFFERTD